MIRKRERVSPCWSGPAVRKLLAYFFRPLSREKANASPTLISASTNHHHNHHVDTIPDSHRHLPLPNPRRRPPGPGLRVPPNRTAVEGQRRHRQRRRCNRDFRDVAVLVLCLDAPMASVNFPDL